MSRGMVGLWVAVLGCSEAGQVGDTAVAVTGSADCDRDPPLNWTNFADGFFAKNCDGCHSSQLVGDARHDAPDGVDFDSENAAAAWGASIRGQVLQSDAMPPGAGLTDEERAMLDEWLTCGLGI